MDHHKIWESVRSQAIVSSSQSSDDFRPTRWTLVGEAGDPSHPSHDEAMAHLLNLYRPALRSHLVRRMRLAEQEADDLLQEFILKKILQYNLMGRADRSRGKFRTLLLTALDNFARSQRPRVPAQESEDAPDLVDRQPMPESSFDLAWARQVISETLHRMEAECRENARLDLWKIFEARIVTPALEGAAAEGYEGLVALHALPSAGKASNLLITAKRMFARNLKSVVSEYAERGDIDDEVADLRQILADSHA